MRKGTYLAAWAVLFSFSLTVSAQTPAEDKVRLEAAQKRLVEERTKARLDAEAKAKADAKAKAEAEAKAASRPAIPAAPAPASASPPPASVGGVRPTKPVPANPDEALAAHTKTVRATEAQYTAAADEARSRLLADLEALKVAVLKAGDLADANAIQAAIKSGDQDVGSYFTKVKSAAAKLAISKYLDTVQAAKKQRDDTTSAAAAELVKVLESAKTAAMGAGDLEKANAFEAAIVKARADAPVYDFAGAQRIVFVVQATGTMVNRLAAVKHELTKAIVALQPTQSYNVLFFTEGGKYYIADKKGLITATADNKRNTYSFLEDVTPTGTTNPIPALEAAFKLNPQVVYFISNGEFHNLVSHREVIAAFKRLNTGNRVKVHTIQVESYDDDAAKTMKAIAAAAGGTYQELKEIER